ncbi:MAG: TIGR00725 family protein [Pseudonocardiaceae bacterium]
MERPEPGALAASCHEGRSEYVMFRPLAGLRRDVCERKKVPYQVAVCGPGRDYTEEDRANAYRVGQLLAERGAVVLCGGGIGVMAAVASGVRSRDGVVVGIRPNDTREGASLDLSVTLVTNMGQARNAIIVWSADAVIVVGGSWGTLSEVALAKRRGGVPVISLGGWRLLDKDGRSVPGIEHVEMPEEAVEEACVNQSGTRSP